MCNAADRISIRIAFAVLYVCRRRGTTKTGTFLGTYEVPKETDVKALGVMWLSFRDDANENIISILAQNF